MSDYTIYALKGDEEWREAVSSSLSTGEGRFGWSYIQDADLRDLKRKIEHGESLSIDQNACYQRFLLEFKKDDYVVYVNVPEWGKCTLARVTGPYEWRFEDTDLNHRFPVDKESVRVFGRNDDVVHPTLAARLKLQGRYWRIYAKAEFEALVEALKSGSPGKPRTAATNRALLTSEIQPFLIEIVKRIQKTHPNYDLEPLVASALKSVPGVKQVKQQGGAGDHGADIIAIIEYGIPVSGLLLQKSCVVQVKSFEGECWDTKAIGDISRAFDYYPDAEMGLIVSTAIASTPAFDRALEVLREETKKPVGLLIGADLAAFLLRFGGELP